MGPWATPDCAKLRALVAGPGSVVGPGVHDALGARIARAEGFRAVYMSGNATSAARIGRPDLGLLTLTEIAQHARGIASAVDLPVLADADTRYGDAAMVARTVAEFEAAGVAGIHLEDQALPKRCGAMPGVRLAPLDEALERLRAALGARSNPEFVIVARTDALATDDYPEALRRARAFAEAGADLVFVEDPRSAEDVERLPRDLPGIPLMIDVFETWPWAQLPA